MLKTVKSSRGHVFSKPSTNSHLYEYLDFISISTLINLLRSRHKSQSPNLKSQQRLCDLPREPSESSATERHSKRHEIRNMTFVGLKFANGFMTCLRDSEVQRLQLNNFHTLQPATINSSPLNLGSSRRFFAKAKASKLTIRKVVSWSI